MIVTIAIKIGGLWISCKVISCICKVITSFIIAKYPNLSDAKVKHITAMFM